MKRIAASTWICVGDEEYEIRAIGDFIPEEAPVYHDRNGDGCPGSPCEYDIERFDTYTLDGEKADIGYTLTQKDRDDLEQAASDKYKDEQARNEEPEDRERGFLDEGLLQKRRLAWSESARKRALGIANGLNARKPVGEYSAFREDSEYDHDDEFDDDELEEIMDLAEDMTGGVKKDIIEDLTTRALEGSGINEGQVTSFKDWLRAKKPGQLARLDAMDNGVVCERFKDETR